MGEELDPNTICTCVKVATPTSVPAPYLKSRSPSPQGGFPTPVCHFICLPGTAHDPNGPACNCNLIATGSTAATPLVKAGDATPSPQGGFPKPVCHFICLPGTAHDPNGPLCNCDLITASPAAATPVVAARDALPSFHCDLICDIPGYHTSPNGCECIRDTPTPIPEKRDPLTGRKCALECEEPGYHASDNGCGCVKDTPAPVKRSSLICPLECLPDYHLVVPCRCVKDTETSPIPTAPTAPAVLGKRDGFTKRRCQIICVTPGYVNSPTGCGCVPASPVKREICPQGCPVGSVLTHPGCKCVGTNVS